MVTFGVCVFIVTAKYLREAISEQKGQAWWHIVAHACNPPGQRQNVHYKFEASLDYLRNSRSAKIAHGDTARHCLKGLGVVLILAQGFDG